jgi:hypothetical protein
MGGVQTECFLDGVVEIRQGLELLAKRIVGTGLQLGLELLLHVWTVQDGPHEVRERNRGGVGACDRHVAGLLRDGELGELDLLAGRGHLGEDGLAGRGAGILDGDFADGAQTVPNGEGALEGWQGEWVEDGDNVLELGGYAADDHGDFAVLDKRRLLLPPPERVKVLAEAKFARHVVCHQGPPFQDFGGASQRISVDLGNGCSDSCFDQLLPLQDRRLGEALREESSAHSVGLWVEHGEHPGGDFVGQEGSELHVPVSL